MTSLDFRDRTHFFGFCGRLDVLPAIGGRHSVTTGKPCQRKTTGPARITVSAASPVNDFDPPERIRQLDGACDGVSPNPVVLEMIIRACELAVLRASMVHVLDHEPPDDLFGVLRKEPPSVAG
jgi:hypothetical protein